MRDFLQVIGFSTYNTCPILKIHSHCRSGIQCSKLPKMMTSKSWASLIHVHTKISKCRQDSLFIKKFSEEFYQKIVPRQCQSSTKQCQGSVKAVPSQCKRSAKAVQKECKRSAKTVPYIDSLYQIMGYC